MSGVWVLGGHFRKMTEEVTDETVLRKIALIKRCLPVESIIDFGGMWGVDGLYARLCKEKLGIPQVTMVDKEESENWKKNPALGEGIDFRRGDFSDAQFMAKIGERYELGLAFDILLHQIDTRCTLALMLSKVRRFFLISQPILPDKCVPFKNCLVLLSGSKAYKLVPFNDEFTKETDYWANFSDPRRIDTDRWIWAITPSFIESLLAGLGWELIHREFWRGWLPRRSKWQMCGLIFKRSVNG